MKKTGLKFKVGLSIVSLFLSLLFLELALRTTGYFVQASMQKEYIPEIDEANTQDNDTTYEHYSTKSGLQEVMCIGDSFTNGGNVQSYDTYPYFLYRDLNSGDQKVSILNYGKCESTTFDTVDRIEAYIKENNSAPSVIILLVGSADLFGNSFGNVTDRTMSPVKVPLMGVVGNFRLYKIYRILKYEFYKRFSFSEKLRIPYTQVSEAERELGFKYFDLIKKIYIPISSKAYSYSDPIIRAEREKALSEKASYGWINEVFPQEKMTGAVYIERIALYLSALYAQKNQHELLIKFLVKIMHDYPEYFWRKNNLKALKYNLLQSLKLQSVIVPLDIIKELKVIEAKFPKIAISEDFLKFKVLVENWEDSLRIVDQRRLKSWEQLEKLRVEHRFKVILQTYPSGYTSANNMLRSIAEKYSYPLVDNNLIFEELIKKDGRGKYLYDDDHCTPEGYKIISDNIQKVFSKIGI